jgi:proline iminopeptidase
MSDPTWREHVLPIPDGTLAWYDAGAGPTVVWINGGPGDDHHYLRTVAAPFTARLRCVLYDQRGCGGSRLERLDAATLDVARFVADLEALRDALGEERLRLVGHSWGATLALLYAAAHPECTERVALVGMGPTDDEMDAVAAANLLKPLSAAERVRRPSWRPSATARWTPVTPPACARWTWTSSA